MLDVSAWHLSEIMTAIVTGATRGIGRAIAISLARIGINIAFNYQKSKKNATLIESEIRKAGAETASYCVDIRDFEAVQKMREKVIEQFGQIDILINNAGITQDAALMMMKREQWQDVIDTNLTGTFNMTRACIVSFMKQKHGKIINITSVGGIKGMPRQTNYSASKGGIIAFTRSLAKEVAQYNVRVNAVAPGFIETDMVVALGEDQISKIEKSIPLGRLGTVDEVAKAVKFLLSEDAQYITGQVIQIDGGLGI